ncbi:Gag-pol fusion protein [Phytophthora megakarya]|uniref:Gag-pol fusion protein n=1 Tax=Phytophthora megakarya TaxID=4795 RepID=A0A225VFT7_9STRA|nr:Gag-pol fusion protein [Phytophthora megakarya]
MPVQDLTRRVSLVVIDAIGPLVTTPRGNKNILAFADYFTRWMEAFLVKTLDAVTPNFISFYETLGIKKRFGAAYHTQTQGLVERFNGTLLGMLRMFVGETHEGWDLYIPKMLFAYRTSYHEALMDSPFSNLYGRDPILLLDLAFLSISPEWKLPLIGGSCSGLCTHGERQLLKAQGRHERRPEGQEAVAFAVGEAVWIYQYFRAWRGERKTKKLAFSGHGSY